MLDGTSWDIWITTIQGPHLDRCDVTTVQRRCLLDLALTYRAFTSHTAGVDSIWYTFFVRSLINIARSHRENEPVDMEMARLTSGLRAMLPPVREASHLPTLCLCSQPSRVSLFSPGYLLLVWTKIQWPPPMTLPPLVAMGLLLLSTLRLAPLSIPILPCPLSTTCMPVPLAHPLIKLMTHMGARLVPMAVTTLTCRRTLILDTTLMILCPR